MSFLSIGQDSEIATEVKRQLQTPILGTTRHLSPDGTRPPNFLDLSEPLGCWLPPTGTMAACIYAAVGKLHDCENDTEATEVVNVTGAIEVTKRLISQGSYVLFLSTSQVFDGTKSFVAADSPTAPLSEYGRQKQRVEQELLTLMSEGCPIGIFRIAKVISSRTGPFRKWRDDLMRGETIDTFNDMYCSPVSIADTGTVIVKLLSGRRNGIWQLSGKRDASYTQIAQCIATRVRAPLHLVNERAAPQALLPKGSTPQHTTLDSTAVTNELGVTPEEPWPVIASALSI